ncbi:MAG: response regulator [Gracilibacteraceae bacterium]|nr:response regulator [Gracilibacteraceae bacterium]
MKKKVLVADDSMFFRTQLCRVLRGADYDVLEAGNGHDCLEMVDRELPDIVLLDIVMPPPDGFDVCRILRDREKHNLMPIILVTSSENLEEKLMGLELGADDYITKPFNERELLSRVRNTLRRVARNRAANPLTGLPGNVEIKAEINRRIALGRKFAVVYVDIDNFKPFNDIYGFLRGDMAIKLTAEIIWALRGEDTFLGHIGGDDFVIITSPQRVTAVCEECIRQFDEKIRLMYDQEHVEQGYISTVNRRGEPEIFPISTLSLSVVTNEYRTFSSELEVADVASELKHKLKQMPGSNYLIDQRKEPFEVA